MVRTGSHWQVERSFPWPQWCLLLFMILASKGAAGVTGAGLATLAGGLQSSSRHPLARAFEGAGSAAIQEARNVAGLGIEGIAGGRRVRTGTEAFCRELATGSLPAPPVDAGLTPVYLADERGWLVLPAVGKRASVVMLYASLAITIGGGLWLLSQPRFGTIAIYAAIFPLLAQFQMLRAHRESKQPTGLDAAALAETAAWRNGDVSHMLAGQVPSPWFRANQQLHQTSPDIARAVLVDDFATTGPPRWLPPDAADEGTLRTLVALLPRPLPTGNPHAEHALAGILLRVGQYDVAAHYAADSYRRSASPVSALVVARSAAALGDRDTAIGWLRAAESVASPAWIAQALQYAPELAQIAGGATPAGDFGTR